MAKQSKICFYVFYSPARPVILYSPPIHPTQDRLLPPQQRPQPPARGRGRGGQGFCRSFVYRELTDFPRLLGMFFPPEVWIRLGLQP